MIVAAIDQLLNKMREQKNGQSPELDGNVFAVKYGKAEVQTEGTIVGLSQRENRRKISSKKSVDAIGYY